MRYVPTLTDLRHRPRTECAVGSTNPFKLKGEIMNRRLVRRASPNGRVAALYMVLLVKRKFAKSFEFVVAATRSHISGGSNIAVGICGCSNAGDVNIE